MVSVGGLGKRVFCVLLWFLLGDKKKSILCVVMVSVGGVGKRVFNVLLAANFVICNKDLISSAREG